MIFVEIQIEICLKPDICPDNLKGGCIVLFQKSHQILIAKRLDDSV